MRTIQSARMVRLRVRRSRYAYASAWVSDSFADRKCRLLAPRWPAASFRTFLWRRCDSGPPFTRGMLSLLPYFQAGNQRSDAPLHARVRDEHVVHFAQRAL